MGSGHHHEGRKASRKRIAITLALAAGYMVAEVVGGLFTNSLALLADAGHMLSDVAALALSLFAMWMAEKPATAKRTYGYYRAEILAALVNAAALGVIAIVIFIEAYARLHSPAEVIGPWMFAIACGGLAINLIGMWILHPGISDSLNVRGAWLHVASDAIGSVGAIVAAVLIWEFGWQLADPIASVAIAVLVLFSSWSLLKEALSVLMESAPGHIDVDEVRSALQGVDGVNSVHDLHVWTITTGLVALSAHVEPSGSLPAAQLLRRIRTVLHDRFGIEHTTIQLEPESPNEGPCAQGCS